MRVSILFGLLLGWTVVSAEQPTQDALVSYWKDVSPVLQKNCVACHRAGQAEGGLSLETPDTLHRGGDSGSLFNLEQPTESSIYMRVTAEEDLMPPEDNTVGARRLTQDEIALLKTWIAQGAEIDQQVTEELGWQPIPDSIRSTYALALSPDDRFVAIGHANRVVVADAQSGEIRQRLADASLPHPGVADLDVVQAIAFSPLGDRIATGGFRTVRIWKRVGSESQLPPVFDASSGSFAVAPSRQSVALVNVIGDIEIRRLDSQQRQVVPSRHGTVTAMAWPSEGRILVGYDGGTIRWIDSVDGSSVGEGKISEPPVRFVISQDGSLVAVLTAAENVKLFQDFVAIESQAINPIADATSIEFLSEPDPRLVIGTKSGGVLIIDPKADAVAGKLDHGAAVQTLLTNKDSTLIVSGGIDGTTKMWSVEDGKLQRTLAGDPEIDLRLAAARQDVVREESWLKQLQSRTEVIKKTLEKEDAALATITEAREKSAKELEEQIKKQTDAKNLVTDTQQKIAAAKRRVEDSQQAAAELAADLAAEIDRETKTLQAQQKAFTDAQALTAKKQADLKKRRQAWATANKTRELAANEVPAHADRIRGRSSRVTYAKHRLEECKSKHRLAPIVAMSFDDDETRLALVGKDGAVCTFDAGSGRPLDRFSASLEGAFKAEIIEPDRLRVEAVDGVHAVDLTKTWILERTIGAVDGGVIVDRVTALDFRGDGTALAIGSGVPSRSGQVALVSISDGAILRTFEDLHSDAVLTLRFSPDGRILATGSADKTIRLVDVQSEQVVGVLDGHSHHVLSLAWKRDGRTIASGSADQTIKVWSTETGQQRRTISGFPDEVTAVAFLKDTSEVASICANGQTRIYNIDNGKLLRSANAAGDFLFTLDTTSDGKRIVTGGQTGDIHVWSAADAKKLGVWE